jgi:hypothetical protein
VNQQHFQLVADYRISAMLSKKLLTLRSIEANRLLE